MLYHFGSFNRHDSFECIRVRRISKRANMSDLSYCTPSIQDTKFSIRGGSIKSKKVKLTSPTNEHLTEVCGIYAELQRVLCDSKQQSKTANIIPFLHSSCMVVPIDTNYSVFPSSLPFFFSSSFTSSLSLSSFHLIRPMTNSFKNPFSPSSSFILHSIISILSFCSLTFISRLFSLCFFFWRNRAEAAVDASRLAFGSLGESDCVGEESVLAYRGADGGG